MMDYIESSIYRGKHLAATRLFLRLLSYVLRVLPAYRLRRLTADGRILLEYQTKRLSAAEDIIFRFSRYQSPSTWAVTSYIARVINLGLDRRSAAIAQSRHMRPELLLLMVSAVKRRDGDLEGALKTLEYTSESYQVRNKVAHARRGIFHQMQDHARLAEEGLKFIQDEPAQLLIPFTITTAGSAETAKRDDIFALAVRRLLDDSDRITNSRKLIRRFWKDAITANLTVFNIEGALGVARLARAVGAGAARKQLAELNELRDETAHMRHITDAAYHSMRERAYDEAPAHRDIQVEFVVPAAAFRSSPIDYPGFRSELRFIVGIIAETLTSLDVPFRVSGRIRTHGELSFPVPSISYHTISDNPKALHFKETDRPSRFSFDTGGYAGWSDFSSRSPADLNLESIDYDEALAYFRGEQVSIIQGNISKYAQAAIGLEETLPEKFVFVGLQVIGDAVQKLAYATPFAMMDEVIETCRQKGLAVVVKRHPQDKNGQLSEYLRNRENNGDITIATGSIHTLIAKSEAVCVVNSGVGAEALLHEKPVYVFGRADYMQACFVCENKGDFALQFEIGRMRLAPEQLHRFWYALRNQYAVSVIDRQKSAHWIRQRIIRHLTEHGVLSANDVVRNVETVSVQENGGEDGIRTHDTLPGILP